MIGMWMRVDDPVDGEVLFCDEAEQLVGRMSACGARCRVEIEYGIDNGAAACCRIDRHVSDAERLRVEKASHYETCTILHLARSEEHTSELQSLMRIPYAVFCLKKNICTSIQ